MIKSILVEPVEVELQVDMSRYWDAISGLLTNHCLLLALSPLC